MSTYLSRFAAAGTVAAAMAATNPAMACSSIYCTTVDNNFSDNTVKSLSDTPIIPKNSDIITEAKGVEDIFEQMNSVGVTVDSDRNLVEARQTFEKASSRTTQDTRAFNTFVTLDEVLSGTVDFNNQDNVTRATTKGESGPRFGHDETVYNQATGAFVRADDGNSLDLDGVAKDNTTQSKVDIQNSSRLIGESRIDGIAQGSSIFAENLDSVDAELLSVRNDTRSIVDVSDSNHRNNVTLVSSAVDRTSVYTDIDDLKHTENGREISAKSTLKLDGADLAINHNGDPLQGFNAASIAGVSDFSAKYDKSGPASLDLDMASKNESALAQTFARGSKFGFGVRLEAVSFGQRAGGEGINNSDITMTMTGGDVRSTLTTTGSSFNFSNQKSQGTTTFTRSVAQSLRVSGGPTP